MAEVLGGGDGSGNEWLDYYLLTYLLKIEGKLIIYCLGSFEPHSLKCEWRYVDCK